MGNPDISHVTSLIQCLVDSNTFLLHLFGYSDFRARSGSDGREQHESGNCTGLVHPTASVHVRTISQRVVKSRSASKSARINGSFGESAKIPQEIPSVIA